MEVHLKIDPVPEGLDGGDDPGRKLAPGHSLEVTAQGPEGAAAEIAEETRRRRAGSAYVLSALTAERG